MDNMTYQSVWRGLDPYREEDSASFFGRDAEAEKLAAEVAQTPLCVVYGASGAGKTSLMRAGVFPRLRSRGLIPVYVLFDHSDGARPYAEQVEAAVLEAVKTAHCDAAEVCGPLSADRAETLWEWFHRHSFTNAFRQPVCPVVVIDQFEEVFTVGEGRGGTDSLLAELSDLAENNVPDVVVHDMEAAEDGFGFSADEQNWRIVVGLREDFLSRLEDRAAKLPVFRRSRFAVVAFRREQALEAVKGPGGALCGGEVAEAIVDAVGKTRAGGAVSVEPALLSLFCMRLDHARQDAGLPQITIELVKARGRDILQDFYEESMSGVSGTTRDLLEDWLLTASGYRDSMAVEDAEAEGVRREELDRLIRDRLLHVEYRGGVSWLELSHDILAPVAREAKERRVREREKATALHKLRRSRRFAAFWFGVVAIILIGLQIWWLAWEKEYSSVYSGFVKVYGNPVGIGRPLSEEQWHHRQFSYRLRYKGWSPMWKYLRGRSPEVFLVEAINGKGERTTTHETVTYLTMGGKGDSASSSSDGYNVAVSVDFKNDLKQAVGKAQSEDALKTVCSWKFERKEKEVNGKTLSVQMNEYGLDKDDKTVWIFNYRHDSGNGENRGNPIEGCYLWPNGRNMEIIYPNVECVRLTYDDNGRESLVEFLDSDGFPTAGPDNAHAFQFCYDGLGRTTLWRSKGWDGQGSYTNIIDKEGNAGMKYEFYDDDFKLVTNDSQRVAKKVARSLGIGEREIRPTYSGYDRVIHLYDEWGNETNVSFSIRKNWFKRESAALTKADELGLNGVSEIRKLYGDNGFLRCIELLAPDGKSGVQNVEKCHRMTMFHDENGDCEETRCFDCDGNYAMPIVKSRYAYRGKVAEKWFEDGNGNPTNLYGVARDVFVYRDGVKCREDEYALPGKGGLYGFTNVHHSVSYFDECGNMTNVLYFAVGDGSEIPTCGPDNAHSHHYRFKHFNGFSRCVENWYLNEKMDPVADRAGAVRYCYDFDASGHTITNFERVAADNSGGLDGLPKVHRCVRRWSTDGKALEESFYDADGKPTAGSDGYWRSKNAYYDNGQCCMIESWAPPGQGGVYGQTNVNHIVFVRNEKGMDLARIAFDRNGMLTEVASGTPGYFINFDSEGNQLGQFGLTPKNSYYGYAVRGVEQGAPVFRDETGKSVDVENVVVIDNLENGGPADKVGLRNRDVLLQYGEYSFLKRDEATNAITQAKLDALNKTERDILVARHPDGDGNWTILKRRLPAGLGRMRIKDDCPIAVSEIKKIEELFSRRLQEGNAE